MMPTFPVPQGGQEVSLHCKPALKGSRPLYCTFRRVLPSMWGWHSSRGAAANGHLPASRAPAAETGEDPHPRCKSDRATPDDLHHIYLEYQVGSRCSTGHQVGTQA